MSTSHRPQPASDVGDTSQLSSRSGVTEEGLSQTLFGNPVHLSYSLLTNILKVSAVSRVNRYTLTLCMHIRAALGGLQSCRKADIIAPLRWVRRGTPPITPEKSQASVPSECVCRCHLNHGITFCLLFFGRPWICLYSDCFTNEQPTSFGRKSDLDRHLQTHPVYRVLFPCPVPGCSRVADKGLPREDKLREHMKRHHGRDDPVARPTKILFTMHTVKDPIESIHEGATDQLASTARSEHDTTELSPLEVPGTSMSRQHGSLETKQDALRNLYPGREGLNDETSSETIGPLGPILQKDSDTRLANADYGTDDDTTLREVHKLTFVRDSDDDVSSLSKAWSNLIKISSASDAFGLENAMTTADRLLMFDTISATMCSGDLQTINLAALCDVEMGPIQFCRGVQRLIKMHGQDLQSETRSRIGKCAAAFLQEAYISTSIAKLIEWQTRTSVQAQCTEKPLPISASRGQNEDNAEGNREASVMTPLDMDELEKLLSDSNARCSYMERLLELAHKPYEKRILKTLGMANRIIDCSGRSLTQQGIALLAQELSWTPVMLLAWSHGRSTSVANQLKGLVEDCMEERWNWWPLKPRLRRLGDGLRRLSWQNVCPLLEISSGLILTLTKAKQDASTCGCARRHQSCAPRRSEVCSGLRQHHWITSRTLTFTEQCPQFIYCDCTASFQIHISQPESHASFV